MITNKSIFPRAGFSDQLFIKPHYFELEKIRRKMRFISEQERRERINRIKEIRETNQARFEQIIKQRQLLQESQDELRDKQNAEIASFKRDRIIANIHKGRQRRLRELQRRREMLWL